MTPRAAAQRWATTWQIAWTKLDTDAIAALYAEDTVLSTGPFRTPALGRDGVRAYVAQAFAAEEDAHVTMGEPIVDGDRAAISWWTALREEGTDATLAGTSVLRFDADGLVTDQWDTWGIEEGRRMPPDASGPFT